jgi:hypothetical protein
MLSVLGLDALVQRGEGEYRQAGVRGRAVFEKAYRVGRESGSTLVRAKPSPVGSAEIIYASFEQY